MFDFLETFSSLQQVSETSPRRLHQLRRRILSATGETSPPRLQDLLETKENEETLQRRCGDDAATSPRRCLTHFSGPRDWARAGIFETSGRIGCHLVSDVALATRRLGERQAIFWSPEWPELPRLISRGDVSANEIGPSLLMFTCDNPSDRTNVTAYVWRTFTCDNLSQPSVTCRNSYVTNP